MSAGDYRKPDMPLTEKNLTYWFNWLAYEMAVRTGNVKRSGKSTVKPETFSMTEDNGENVELDLVDLMDRFFDLFDAQSQGVDEALQALQSESVPLGQSVLRHWDVKILATREILARSKEARA